MSRPTSQAVAAAHPPAQRVPALDWLRGLLALAIMTYHLTNFAHGGSQQWDAGSLIGKLGIYGVAVFFLLSGLSMTVGYDHSLGNWHGIARFWLRRLFRLLPLLWLVLALVLVPLWWSGGRTDALVLLLNLSASFGFVQPDAYINTGAWTIGNEMVYYALTPLLLLAYRRRLWLGNALLLGSLALAAAYAGWWLDPDQTLAEQWNVYVEPMDNLFLYVTGVALYYNLKPRAWAPGWPLLLLAALAFALVPASGDQIVLITGARRLLLPLLCSVVVAVCWRGSLRLPRWLDRGLEHLGLVSYGIYLLHPIVFGWLQPGLNAAGFGQPLVLEPVVMLTTVLLASLLWRYYEEPMVKLGRRLSQRWLN